MKEESGSSPKARKRTTASYGELLIDDMVPPMEKKMRSDSLSEDPELSADKSTMPDSTKTEELMDGIEKRLEIPHEMCQAALDKLHKQGFVLVAGLKTLTKELWMRLGLPLAIEEELKNQIYGRVTYTALPVQMLLPASTWNSQLVNAQPVYLPGYHGYFENAEMVDPTRIPEDANVIHPNTAIYTQEKLEMLEKIQDDGK